jgi:hypothetical protein
MKAMKFLVEDREKMNQKKAEQKAEAEARRKRGY